MKHFAGVVIATVVALSAVNPAANAQASFSVAPSPTRDARNEVEALDDVFVVGAGDSVRIGVFQNPDLSVETRVDGAGRMTYPFLGALQVGGKTPAQIEQMIAAGLEEKQILRRPQVTVNVLQFRSQQVAVLGQVNRPGKYPLDLPYSVSDVLALAGGVTPAGADSVVLRRATNGTISNTEIDLVQMFVPGGTRAEDVAVLPGDVLFVHRAPLVYIYGEVQRPGPMRLERDMTVLQALSSGGGLTQRGTRRGVVITRKDATGTPVEVEAALSTTLRADDVIYVRESWF